MINDVIKKVRLHRDRANEALKEINAWETLDCKVFDDFEKIKTVDMFIYRFTKFQDMMGDKLFKVFLDEIGEYKRSMSLLDILDKLEQFEVIDRADDWMFFRKLRNTLTHEYPDNEKEIIEGIRLAIKSFYKIDDILNNIVNYFKRRDSGTQ